MSSRFQPETRTDGYDAAVPHGDVGPASRNSGAIDDLTAGQQEIDA
ncbi:hypothetical protein AB0N21_22865 [Streptomyces sp. NPDC051080]